MAWYVLISYFFGGAFLGNSVPHFCAGVMGKKFPSPFAKPPGKGLSSAMVNALWGFLNLVVGYFLIFKVGAFQIQSLSQVGIIGVGILAMAVMLSSHFGSLDLP